MAAFDILIRNGTIIDGSGESMYKGDLGIKDGHFNRIEEGAARANHRIGRQDEISLPFCFDVFNCLLTGSIGDYDGGDVSGSH